MYGETTFTVEIFSLLPAHAIDEAIKISLRSMIGETKYMIRYIMALNNIFFCNRGIVTCLT